MGDRYRFTAALIGGLLFIAQLAGCAAGPERTISVRDGGRRETVRMTASNFDFDPTVIKASPGEVLTLAIENVSGTDHNFTLKNPAGEILNEVDLPEKSTREVRIELSEEGTYPFHCDKPFHATLGMEGRIEVE